VFLWGGAVGRAAAVERHSVVGWRHETLNLLKSLWRALRTWFKLIYDEIAQK